MVKHIILWKLKEDLSTDEKKQILENMKENLEGLVGKVPGLTRMNVVINPLASSNAEVMLDSDFLDDDARKGYQTHKEHVYVANTYVRPYTDVRLCMDYKV